MSESLLRTALPVGLKFSAAIKGSDRGGGKGKRYKIYHKVASNDKNS